MNNENNWISNLYQDAYTYKQYSSLHLSIQMCININNDNIYKT